MSGKGINKLSEVFDTRAKKHDDKPPLLDFGEIQNDMSLLTNNFPRNIPQSDYVVCRSVAGSAKGGIFSTTQGAGKNGSGRHWHGKHGQHPHGESGEHPHGDSGEHPHGTSGDHEHDLPDGETADGGAHDHPDTEGTHSHPETEGTHTHPEEEGAHEHPADEGEMEHVHDVLVGDYNRGLQPGDRVLVVWVGDDACVVDIIFPATVIRRGG